MWCGACAVSGPTAGLPDADSAALETYVQYCGSCHGLAHPGRHRASQWPALVTAMEQRMRERGMPLPSDDERQAILGYLQAHAR